MTMCAHDQQLQKKRIYCSNKIRLDVFQSIYGQSVVFMAHFAHLRLQREKKSIKFKKLKWQKQVAVGDSANGKLR